MEQTPSTSNLVELAEAIRVALRRADQLRLPQAAIYLDQALNSLAALAPDGAVSPEPAPSIQSEAT